MYRPQRPVPLKMFGKLTHAEKKGDLSGKKGPHDLLIKWNLKPWFG